MAHALRAVGRPGDRVLTFAPFFPEYRPYVEGAGLRLEVVPAHVEDFQIQFDELEKRLAPDVAAVLINTPNNPSGVVYTEATLRRLAALLKEKQREWGPAHLPDQRRTLPGDRVQRRARPLPGRALSQHPDLLLLQQIAEPAGGTDRVCGRRAGLRRGGNHHRDLRADFPGHRPQLPALHHSAGGGPAAWT